jgi:hypothetical protein
MSAGSLINRRSSPSGAANQPGHATIYLSFKQEFMEIE